MNNNLNEKAKAVLSECPWCLVGVKRVPLAPQFRDYLGHPHAEHHPADIAAADTSSLVVGYHKASYPMWCGLDDAPYELAVAVLRPDDLALEDDRDVWRNSGGTPKKLSKWDEEIDDPIGLNSGDYR